MRNEDEHKFNGLFHIVEVRNGHHFGHGTISSPPFGMPETGSYEEGLQEALNKAKSIDGGRGVTVIQELGKNVLPS
jgi:hypothetical protein